MITILVLTLTGCLLGRQVFANQQQVERTFVECGVTITERADASPKIGSCQMNTTGDPRVFGPDAWKTFHRFANSYPESPNKKTITACINFVHALPYMLPCSMCGLDLKEFIENNEVLEGTFNDKCAASEEYGMPCQSVEAACTTQPYLVNWFLRAHYNVGRHTNPCRTLWTPEQAAKVYGSELLCAKNVVWGGCGRTGVCRAQHQPNCVDEAKDCPLHEKALSYRKLVT
ncbi:hypothetical protein CEUSTIGMA_g12054.t1 [Chlamydomonas eustigma]|uniref:Sulfhydryl oxidase n=1 Tax=Chlamydomonas eustigma TaxID=1157962 RepID=A0A250XNR0_9CHLO|nr:hypothetical protein CEUSTIGMA_g12054.t1 [Chlamydomonas eustigma]|eukprot:GAX84633.1 hypothetical protein CEUSTIGMA_g12054.t1 [Chlamydomonas eustigma]